MRGCSTKFLDGNAPKGNAPKGNAPNGESDEPDIDDILRTGKPLTFLNKTGVFGH